MSADLFEPASLRERMRTWAATAMTRVKIDPLPDSQLVVARVDPGHVPALRNVAGMGLTEEIAMEELSRAVDAWVEARIGAGKALPELSKEATCASPDILKCIRMRTLRGLVLHRGSQWGVQRTKLSRAFLLSLASDFDRLVSQRVASQLESAS